MAALDWADVSRAAFEAADTAEAAELCTRLAERMAALFRSRTDSWPGAAYSAVDALRAVGHDLWSFDEDGQGWQAWCGDYSRAEPLPAELILELHIPDRVEVTWLRGNPKIAIASAIAGTVSASAKIGE